MAMNREQKRLLQKRGHVDGDGQPVARARDRSSVGTQDRPSAEKTSPGQFVKEVRAELRKVAWPTRFEVINYSIVVLITLIIMTLLIAGLDWVFGEAVLRLFDAK